MLLKRKENLQDLRQLSPSGPPAIQAALCTYLDSVNCYNQKAPMWFKKKTMKTSFLYPQAQPPARWQPVGYGTLTAAMATESALAANTERGSVPSSTLLSGSTTELEDEDVEEVLPFWLTFLVLDSETCGNNHGGEMESPPTLPLKHLKGISLLPWLFLFLRVSYFVTNWHDSESQSWKERGELKVRKEETEPLWLEDGDVTFS